MNVFQRSLARALPLSFVIGAGIEFFMLRMQVGSETFYDTVIRLESERRNNPSGK
eukprot:m.9947 g.9947  ORF g.9947 m.9947 type:complete len:55 (+) comp4170_c0_seq1:80-244(+)